MISRHSLNACENVSSQFSETRQGILKYLFLRLLIIVFVLIGTKQIAISKMLSLPA
nr:MAG TPA: hypothetical protein [Caudoviricetes sp.]